jgi:hypothetical protein
MPRRTTLTFFFTVFFFYLAFSPAVFRSMGYMEEEVLASKYLLSKVGLFPPPPGVTEVPFPRNGFATLTMHMPFLLIANVLFHGSVRLEDAVLAIEPVVSTAVILTILFVWIRRITQDWTWSVVLPLVAGFSTMLWPYAYIGLETTQAMFVVAAAFLAFESGGRRSWPRAIALGFFCAMAVSAKSTGLVLLPAMIFAVWRFYRSEGGGFRIQRAAVPKMVVTLAILFAIFVPNYLARAVFWEAWGGRDYLKFWAIKNPISYVLNLIAYVGSPNKGLIVFAPIAVIGLLSLSRAWKASRELTVFIVLVIGCGMGAFSLLIPWTDENWGPRYLHTSVSPLVLSFALSRSATAFRVKREVPLLIAALFGLGVSFLGAIYSYGALHVVATETNQSTLQNLQGNPVWNHVTFNARLFRLWLTAADGTSTVWLPFNHWYFEVPRDAPPFKGRDLVDVMEPHSVLLRHWGSTEGTKMGLWLASLVCLVAALSLSIASALRVVRGRRRVLASPS